ncbi:Serine/threonine-protein kinase PknB [Planctomycetes bacterium K23_9]|uniref:Serine/threonine-protein kinase PknB n=2 Tax=Stieleria marina TaxID=1930275 RepID=A0A517P368_9BACT|nr:Serine/threonine-protein kinase PknB [Planctomycetes bacterium K23_9]
MRGAKAIFEEVCDLEESQQRSALDRLCGDNASLRNEVQSLLAAQHDAGEFLNQPTLGSADSGLAPTLDTVDIAETAGSQVDRYKLLEKIGEGGFGVVYMAQQDEPIRRRVALKIIKLGMDTQQVVARFEAERQALAMMDHPNIARVIDGGSTETGRPYFVMELVRGDSITAYCDQKRLPLRERLQLFQQVCRAIEHAHQKGIIHRDIKPSNVLVTISDDQPLVKVIDFGIAKATNASLTDKTLFTQFRQLIGTPLYMSPEQAERSGVDIDTRTDIYSLGVLLYEMLTGRTPLDPQKLNSAALGELQRMISEDEPSKPSVLVSSAIGDFAQIAQARSVDASRLGNSLSGDLDWIVLKALEKDRSRRYSGASVFAADIDRYLNDEAVEATPPSRTYQLRKFARRNRGMLATAATLLVALLLGLVGTSVAAAWAIKEKRLATEARLLAEQNANTAERNEKSARRAALLAGASPMLPEADARALAGSWKAEIAELKKRVGVEHVDATKLQTQYTSWFATWLSQHQKWDEAKSLIDEVYPLAKQNIGPDDPAFMSLCNLRYKVGLATNATKNQSADTFTDLFASMTAIHGKDKAAVLLPEYAGALASAGRNDEASRAIAKFVAYRSKQSTPLTILENTRIDIAIEQLIDWGQTHPKLMQQLKRIRDVGITTDQNASVDNDDELASDLKKLQGRWKEITTSSTKLTMTQEFDGQTSTTFFVDQDSNIDRGHSARFALTRSGSVKVLTSYIGKSKNNGMSFVYHLDGDTLSIVSKMLSNHNSLPVVEFHQWKKTK